MEYRIEFIGASVASNVGTTAAELFDAPRPKSPLGQAADAIRITNTHATQYIYIHPYNTITSAIYTHRLLPGEDIDIAWGAAEVFLLGSGATTTYVASQIRKHPIR